LNEILDFSKVEAGTIELELIDFDLRAAVEDVADLLAERAHEKGLELVTAVQPGVQSCIPTLAGRIPQRTKPLRCSL
jgi:signal transduction histidine kinase